RHRLGLSARDTRRIRDTPARGASRFLLPHAALAPRPGRDSPVLAPTRRRGCGADAVAPGLAASLVAALDDAGFHPGRGRILSLQERQLRRLDQRATLADVAFPLAADLPLSLARPARHESNGARPRAPLSPDVDPVRQLPLLEPLAPPLDL